MSQRPVTQKATAEKVVQDIRRATRRRHSAEEKIQIALAGLRGADSMADELITGLAFIVVKAAAAFHTKTTCMTAGRRSFSKPASASPNPLWQTDFTSLKVIGWGWYDPSTILDDFSRASSPGSWARRCAPRTSPTPRSGLAGLRRQSGPCPAQTPAPVGQRPQLSSPILLTGSTSGSAHIRGAPGQPQTQGKIERWQQTLKNPIRLENYDLPGDLDAQIKASVERYTHRRDHESIDHRIRPTSISAVAKPSGSSGNAATARPSTSVVGFTASKPHKISPPDEPQPPLSQAAIRPKCVDDGRGRDLKNWMRRRNLRFRWLCRVIVVINAAPFSGLFCCSPQGGATRVGR
jgi:putative transposase